MRALVGCGAGAGARRAPSRAAGGLLLAALCAAQALLVASGELVPPVAEPRPKLLEAHGDVRVDNYYWLRDDARQDPDVLSYLAAENNHTAAAMEDTRAVQQLLYQEMRSRIQEADTTVASRRGGYFYYSRTEQGAQHPVHCRRAVPPGAGPLGEADEPDESQPEEVVLDENGRKAAGNFTFYMIGSVEPSPNHRLLAWSEDTVGGEKFTVHIKDIATGEELTEPIPFTSGDVVWANDNAHVFYTVKDELDRPFKVLRHKVGAGEPDAVVFEEPDESFYVSISRANSDQMIFIGSSSAVTNETRWASADEPTGEFAVVLPRSQDVEYCVSHHPGGAGAGAGGGWFAVKVRDAARPNSELRVAPVDDPEQQTVLLPHREDVMLVDAAVSERWLVVSERSNAQDSLTVYELPASGAMPTQLGQGRRIEFDEQAFSLSGGITGDFSTDVLRLYYNSMTTPTTVYDQNLNTGRRALKKAQVVLGGFSRHDYETRRLWATAADGAEVPISLVFRKDLARLDGSDPLLLHGYGAYGYSYDASFNRNELSLLNRGWTVAIAHIRGGSEMGRRWYEDGKFLHKRNTFTDFIACAEHLVNERYTSPDRLAIEGRSAGGLLMGSVTNMRPDLFKSVIMGVPFVDALTTMLDPTIPLTITEWEEWGDPVNEESYYRYMKSYSPVDNVVPQDYPNILVFAGLHDPRVGYWEPAKLVAKLRATKTDSNTLLLKTDTGAGHFSVTGRFERLKETALEYAWFLKTLGLLDSRPAPSGGGAGANFRQQQQQRGGGGRAGSGN